MEREGINFFIWFFVFVENYRGVLSLGWGVLIGGRMCEGVVNVYLVYGVNFFGVGL